MDVFTAGTEVSVVVPLTDDAGNSLSVTSIAYRITDQNSFLFSAPLDGFVAGSTQATVTVSAAVNTLTEGISQALRSIELRCTLAGGNSIDLTTSFAIARADTLEVGVNSFQSYAQAEFTSLSVPNIDSWNAASRVARQAALIDARSHICQLSFTPLNDSVNWGQDSLNYIPEGTRSTNYVGGMLSPGGDLGLLTAEQYAQLPPRFLDALAKAQLVEADSILGGDTIERKRMNGLVQDVIGESSQTYRQGKPLEMPVSRRALRYLSLYITYAKRIGRG